MATLGTSTSDDYWNTGSGIQTASSAVAPASGNLDDISIIFNGTPTGNMYLGVYADNGSDSPGSLLLDAGAIAVGAGTKTITGLTLAITSGTKYWMTSLSNGSIATRALNNQGATSTRTGSQLYGSLPATFPAIVETKTWKWTIYGTITASSGVANAVYMIFES
jgi:hypothetical protein